MLRLPPKGLHQDILPRDYAYEQTIDSQARDLQIDTTDVRSYYLVSLRFHEIATLPKYKNYLRPSGPSHKSLIEICLG